MGCGARDARVVGQIVTVSMFEFVEAELLVVRVKSLYKYVSGLGGVETV